MVIDSFIHRVLRLPYRLHATVTEPAVKSFRAPTILFLHGIGGSGEAWRQVTKTLPPNYRIVIVDLLGFGKSPKPAWATYDVKRQARSVFLTYLRLRLNGKVIVVGHSLGALVAVEFAKTYPWIVASLILCSPPFYKRITPAGRGIADTNSMLRELYRLIKRHPEQFIRISTLAVKLGLINKSVSITRESMPIYLNALEASIINQTAFEDAARIRQDTLILYGRLDPVVVSRNLRELATENNHIKLPPNSRFAQSQRAIRGRRNKSDQTKLGYEVAFSI